MSDPVTPEPDVKDWTWAITQPCPDCGFDPSAVRHADVPDRTRRYVAVIASALDRPEAATRPGPAVWSPLEYACHARDVCDLFAHRLELMLTEDDPSFANWDQDETALEQRYWEQDAATVRAQLTESAETTAERFAAVRDDEWERPGRRSDGSLFTVDTFARYFLHDLAHHAWDVRR